MRMALLDISCSYNNLYLFYIIVIYSATLSLAQYIKGYVLVFL